MFLENVAYKWQGCCRNLGVGVRERVLGLETPQHSVGPQSVIVALIASLSEGSMGFLNAI